MAYFWLARKHDVLDVLADPHLQSFRFNACFLKHRLPLFRTRHSSNRLLCCTQVRVLVINNDHIRVIRVAMDAVGYDAPFLTHRGGFIVLYTLTLDALRVVKLLYSQH